MALRLVRTDNGGFTYTDPSIGSSQFFISLWIKPTLTGVGINGAYPIKAGNASGAIGDFAIGVTSGGAVIFILWRSTGSESNNGLLSGGVLSDGQPHHILCGWDGTSRRLFVDGSEPTSGQTTLPPVLGTEAYVGRLRAASPDDEYFDGDIEDIGIHIGAFATSQQIEDLAAGQPLNNVGVTWDRQYPLTTNLDDLSANNDNGVLVDGTFVSDFVVAKVGLAASIAATSSVAAALDTTSINSSIAEMHSIPVAEEF